jgi:hypothetical protein
MKQIAFFLNERDFSTYGEIKRHEGIQSILFKKSTSTFLEYNSNTNQYNIVYSGANEPEAISITTFEDLIAQLKSINNFYNH